MVLHQLRYLLEQLTIETRYVAVIIQKTIYEY